MTDVKIRRGDLREALITHAQEEAKAGTIEQMSLRHAARELGVSSGAVYRHFDDKDALLQEIVLRGMHELKAKFAAIRPKDAPARSVELALHRGRELVRTYIQFAQDNPSLWHLMFGRIGAELKHILMCDPEEASYTAFDVCHENMLDLWRLGALKQEPSLDDVRYVWSATHGAAELTLSHQRIDFAEIDAVCDQTSERNMRAIGFAG
ncbi:MAG: TetR/AcrR family transcriptional regulator [Pseudomonadota bacterium]